MAKKQDILLVKDVLKLGNMGDIIKVAPGFARNYLLPERLGIPASQAQRRQVEVLRERAAKSETEREASAIALKKTVDGMTVQIGARVAHDLELFGSIGTKEVVAALAKKGVVVDTKQVHLTDKLRKLGVYPIEVRLHKKVAAEIKLEIVNSDPTAPSLADTLAAMAAAKLAKKAKPEAAAEGDGAADAAKGEKSEKPAKGDKAAKPAKAEKSEKPAKGDKAAKPAKADKNDKKKKG
jgi:large subunit ribosomal protein L9